MQVADIKLSFRNKFIPKNIGKENDDEPYILIGKADKTYIKMINGFLRTDKNRIKMAETFNATKWQIFTKIVFPSNIPTLFNAFKVNIGLCMVGVITGEFLVSKGGLGHLIVYGGQVFKLDLVMASTVVLCVLATLMYAIVALLEKIIIKHKY